MKLNSNISDKLFFISDTHYMHKNICLGVSNWADKYPKEMSDEEKNIRLRQECRHFNDLTEMNDAIVNNINNKVPSDAILFHTGDWSFGGRQNIKAFRDRLNVNTIHLIGGNHDDSIMLSTEFDSLFESILPYMELEVGSNKFQLLHYPMEYWRDMNKGAYHLHGHEHWDKVRKFGDGRRMDIGVDGNNMMPYSYEEIISLLQNRKKQILHHG